MIKHYVEFLYPGLLFSETSSKELKSKNAPIAWPNGAYAYRLFTKEVTKGKTGTLEGDPKYKPGYIFRKGTVIKMAKEVLADRDPANETLRSNVSCNKFKAVAFTKHGQVFPFNLDKDKVEE